MRLSSRTTRPASVAVYTVGMKVLILGASGRTGRILVEQALVAGHDVTALVRNGNKWKSKEHLTVTVGDARDSAAVEGALRGQDAVISVLGSRKPKSELASRSLRAVVSAAQAAGVRRVIVLSTYMLTPNFRMGMVSKLAHPRREAILKDRRAGEVLLRKADLDWTIVYATALDKAPSGMQVRSVGPDEKLTTANAIARADAARFLLGQLGYPAAYQQAVIITTK